jgi:glycosyltransferase involved in cell wall biosynthesis
MRFLIWLLKVCFATKDFLASILRTDTQDWGPTFVPYQIRVREPERPAPYRVFHFIANFVIGGSTQLVVDLIERLGPEYSHTVFCAKLPNPPPYQGAKVHSVKTPKDLAKLDQLLRATKPDIAHVHFWRHPWYSAIFGMLEANNCAVIENVNVPVSPFVSPIVSRYIYVSEFSRREFSLETPNDLVVYPGSDLSLFSQRERSSLSPCLGMVYRLEADKLDDNSILPFIYAIQRDSTLRALIVGDGQLLPSYRSQVDRCNLTASFEFPRYVSYSALPHYVQMMSLFLAPVHSESFGQVTSFAMAQGIAVIGYRVGALPEIVDDPRLLVDPGDFRALGELALCLLRDPQRLREIGERNRRRAMDLFSVEHMVTQYRDIYQAIINPTLRTIPSPAHVRGV